MQLDRTAERRLAGRYVLRAPLGRGGMGVVWEADDTLLGRRVAVKEVEFPASLSDEERAALRTRVFREARAAARLTHPAAVTLFDVVEEDGRPYIVMELVQAPTLAQVVEREGPLAPARAAQVALDVLGALEEAHRQGIVHRDVKPANVMVPATGPARLTDFGIAAIKGDPRVTSSGVVLGSPAFMAPEQAQEETAGTEVDLWSLGATAYFAVEGVPPFERGNTIATLTAVVHDPPRAPERAGPLGPVLLALLDKDPAQRPADGGLRTRLEAVAAPRAAEDEADDHDATVLTPVDTQPMRDVPRPTATVAPDPAPAPAPTPDPTPDRRQPAPSAGRWWRLAALVAVVAVPLGLLALWAASQRATKTPTGDKAPTATDAPQPGAQTDAKTPAKGQAKAQAKAKVPSGWVAYTDPSTGYRIAHPAGWTVTRQGSLTDFRDPRSGSYLRVDWTATPGPSPQADWERFEPTFAGRSPGYRRVHMRPTTFQGYTASDWEYTYSAGGATLHAVDLGFVTGRYGFALNFQTREENWDRSQSTFSAFKDSFVAPA